MSENSTNSDSALSTSHSALDQEDEISLLDLAIVLAKHKWQILGFPFAAAVIAAIYSWQSAVRVFMPPQGLFPGACHLIQQLMRRVPD